MQIDLTWTKISSNDLKIKAQQSIPWQTRLPWDALLCFDFKVITANLGPGEVYLHKA